MFEQVKLDYSFEALEPHIDTLTMETHYGKHHATYTKNFNDAVEKAGLSGKSVEEILAIDVWEHAYYLKYKNLRAEYIQNFFAVLNWEKVSENYQNRG